MRRIGDDGIGKIIAIRIRNIECECGGRIFYYTNSLVFRYRCIVHRSYIDIDGKGSTEGRVCIITKNNGPAASAYEVRIRSKQETKLISTANSLHQRSTSGGIGNGAHTDNSALRIYHIKT